MGDKIYIVMSIVLHKGDFENWFVPDDEDLHVVEMAFLKKESAIKYIEDLFPGNKVEDDMLEFIIGDDVDEEDPILRYGYYGEKIQYFIKEFPIQ